MRIIRTITLDKYLNEEKYKYIENNIYQNLETGNHCIALYCILDKDENEQYPLEDFLDKYLVELVPDTLISLIDNGENILLFELENLNGKDLVNLSTIKEIRKLVGKEVSLEHLGNSYNLVIK